MNSPRLKKFVFYVCPECGNVSRNEEPHKKLPTYEERGRFLRAGIDMPDLLYCETETIRMGALPFDEEEFDSLDTYYEDRMNKRAEILAKQKFEEMMKPTETLEQAAEKTLSTLRAANRPAGSQFMPSLPPPGDPGLTYTIMGKQVTYQEYCDAYARLEYEKAIKEYEEFCDSMQQKYSLEKTKKKKRWYNL